MFQPNAECSVTVTVILTFLYHLAGYNVPPIKTMKASISLNFLDNSNQNTIQKYLNIHVSEMDFTEARFPLTTRASFTVGHRLNSSPYPDNSMSSSHTPEA